MDITFDPILNSTLVCDDVSVSEVTAVSYNAVHHYSSTFLLNEV